MPSAEIDTISSDRILALACGFRTNHRTAYVDPSAARKIEDLVVMVVFIDQARLRQRRGSEYDGAMEMSGSTGRKDWVGLGQGGGQLFFFLLGLAQMVVGA